MNTTRLKTLLLGLAAGDSLGSTCEFTQREDMPRLYQEVKNTGWPFKQVGGGPFGWQAGAPTDDTDMALCLVRSYLRCGGFEGADVAAEFVQWLLRGPSDIGNATRRSLQFLRSGAPWHEAGLAVYRENAQAAANGSLMRNGVVPALADSLDQALSISIRQSLISHYGPLPVLCCCAHSYLIWEFLDGRNPFAGNWIQAVLTGVEELLAGDSDPVLGAWRQTVGSHFDEAAHALFHTDFHPSTSSPYQVKFSGNDGYCLLTLQIAVWAAQWSQQEIPFPTPTGFPREVFAKAVGPTFLPAVVMCGHDSDTYGAVAGPLIAAIHGSVPPELTTRLRVLDEMRGWGWV